MLKELLPLLISYESKIALKTIFFSRGQFCSGRAFWKTRSTTFQEAESKFLTLGLRLKFQRNHGNKENGYNLFLRRVEHQRLGRCLEKPPYISIRYTENQFQAGTGSYCLTRVSCEHLFTTLISVTCSQLEIGKYQKLGFCFETHLLDIYQHTTGQNTPQFALLMNTSRT